MPTIWREREREKEKRRRGGGEEIDNGLHLFFEHNLKRHPWSTNKNHFSISQVTRQPKPWSWVRTCSLCDRRSYLRMSWNIFEYACRLCELPNPSFVFCALLRKVTWVLIRNFIIINRMMCHVTYFCLFVCVHVRHQREKRKKRETLREKERESGRYTYTQATRAHFRYETSKVCFHICSRPYVSSLLSLYSGMISLSFVLESHTLSHLSSVCVAMFCSRSWLDTPSCFHCQEPVSTGFKCLLSALPSTSAYLLQFAESPTWKSAVAHKHETQSIRNLNLIHKP